MIDTPQKILLDMDFTPHKVIVQSDINGWMETNKKQETPRIRIRKNMPPKSISSNIQTTIHSLKKRHQELMKSSSKKKQFLYSGTTQPGTSDGEKQKSQLRKTTQWYRKLPLVHVNEFVAEQKDQFQRNTMIKPCKGLSLTDQRKQSLCRNSLQKLKKHQKEINQLKENRPLLNNSSQVLKQNVCKDHYTSLSKKTINILLKLRNGI